MTTQYIGHQMEVGPLIASGVLHINKVKESARTEFGQAAYSASIGSLSKFVTTAHPATGKLIEGFHWDERAWSTEDTDNIAVTVPSNWDPSTSGISKSHFQSGIGSNRDLELEDIKVIPGSGINGSADRNIWAPEIKHGYYYDFSTRGYLYSDDSEVVYPTYSGVVSGLNIATVSGFNKVPLLSIPKVGVPISVVQFEWDPVDGRHDIILDLSKKIQFTGKRDSNGSRQLTYDTAKEERFWDLIDQSLNEFIVEYSGISNGDLEVPEVILNNQYVTEVGSLDSIPSGLEVVGISTGSAKQQFNLKYSPVDAGMSVDIYSYVTTSGAVTKWTPVPFSTNIPVGVRWVKLDHDLGILQFGDTTISGVLAPPGGHTVAAHYWRTVRVEYEPQLSQDTIKAVEANTNPIYRRGSRGFVYLATRLEDPASIELSAQLPLIQETVNSKVYGPLPIGNGFTPLIATVKDTQGHLLEDQEVTFFIKSNPPAGSFGTLGETITSITGPEGEAKAFYNPPSNISQIGESITASGHSIDNSPSYPGITQTTTLHTEKLLIEGDLSDIFLYQVHIDDPLQGLLDSTVADTIEAQVEEYYRKYFIEQQIFGPTGLTTTSGISNTSGLSATEWEANHRLIWNLSRPLIFQDNIGLGKKVLVAKLDANMLNPHTFTPGAVGPVQPIDVVNLGNSEYDVVFDTSSHSIPVPSGTLHSYFLIAPTTVTLQASVFNQRLNQTILSNEVQIKLNIPPYLSGLWIIDAINQNEIDQISSLLSNIVASGQRVPLGFRLRSSAVTLAAALDNVTFLDVNVPFNSDIYNPDAVPGSGVHVGHQVTLSGIL